MIQYLETVGRSVTLCLETAGRSPLLLHHRPATASTRSTATSSPRTQGEIGTGSGVIIELSLWRDYLWFPKSNYPWTVEWIGSKTGLDFQWRPWYDNQALFLCSEIQTKHLRPPFKKMFLRLSVTDKPSMYAGQATVRTTLTTATPAPPSGRARTRGSSRTARWAISLSHSLSLPLSQLDSLGNHWREIQRGGGGGGLLQQHWNYRRHWQEVS